MAAKKFSIEFDRSLLSRLTRTIDSLILSPFQGKPLTGNKRGCYSLREGDYRIIYEVYPTKSIIHIIRIGHRRDVYR